MAAPQPRSVAGTLILSCVSSGQGAYLVDAGRPHSRALGVVGGGAADPAAAAAANDLLGQDSQSCCLELTLVGGSWHLSGRGQIALTGADMRWQLNGKPAARYSLLSLDGGEHVLTGTLARQGCRAYLGIRGRWGLPRVLGSVERGLPGTLSIAVGTEIAISCDHESDYREVLAPPPPPQPLTLAVMRGPEWRQISAASCSWLLQTTFTVSPESDRQGIRLVADALPGDIPNGILSSPVLPGTVQLTPQGPILLGPDAQTVGGYPRVLLVEHYAAAFQLRPGEKLQFRLGQ